MTAYPQTAGNAGLVATRRNRQTGHFVSVYDAAAQGISPADGGRWAVVCEPHGGLLQTDSKATALSLMADAWDWCPNCQTTCNRRSRFGRCTLPKDHPVPEVHAEMIGDNPPVWFTWRVGADGRARAVGYEAPPSASA